MFTVSASTLRRVLWLDAASGLGMGLSHLALSEPLSGWTGIPATWLQVAALVVFGAASLAGWLASRANPRLAASGCWRRATSPGSRRASGWPSVPACR